MKLDDAHYKMVDQMESLVDAPPSLVNASSLTVKGAVKFSKGRAHRRGAVESNTGRAQGFFPTGSYCAVKAYCLLTKASP